MICHLATEPVAVITSHHRLRFRLKFPSSSRLRRYLGTITCLLPQSRHIGSAISCAAPRARILRVVWLYLHCARRSLRQRCCQCILPKCPPQRASPACTEHFTQIAHCAVSSGCVLTANVWRWAQIVYKDVVVPVEKIVEKKVVPG